MCLVTRNIVLISLISVTHLVTGCSEQKVLQNMKDLSRTEEYYDPFHFYYYPATILLKNGDTINGRFTLYRKQFNLLHENPDSNHYDDKNFLNVAPGDFYYKKYLPTELKAYIVNKQRYEPVIITTTKKDDSYIPGPREYEFMIRLTPDNSSIHLYKHFEPDYDKKSILLTILFPADTIMNNIDYNIQYYLHFPDEHPSVAWRIDVWSVYNKKLKSRFVEVFQNCPALAETSEKIQQLSNTGFYSSVLASPDSTIRTRGIRAILDRLTLFDACYKKRKPF